MKTTSTIGRRGPDIVRNILDVATCLAAACDAQLSFAAIGKAANVPASAIRAVFPKIEALVDALYLDLCARKSAAIQTLHDPARSMTDRAYAIWHGHVMWARQAPLANKALNSLNLAHMPSNKARTIEALNFPDLAVAEQFAANQTFADCDPIYADAVAIALVDATVELIKLNPGQEAQYLRTGFELIERLFFQ